MFVIVLSTMMIPYHVVLIPQYLIFRDLGWLDTPLPIIVPNWFGGGAFFIFMMRQFFMSLNREIDEAARIDGCGFFATFWRVILPQSLPALGALSIFTFMGEWNDFFAPLIYLNTEEKMTLAVAIRTWQFDTNLTYQAATWPELMVMSTILDDPAGAGLLFPAASLHSRRGRHRRQGLTRDTALGPPVVQRVDSRPRASVQLCAPAAVPDRGGMILAQSALRLCVSMFADGGGYPFKRLADSTFP